MNWGRKRCHVGIKPLDMTMCMLPLETVRVYVVHPAMTLHVVSEKC